MGELVVFLILVVFYCVDMTGFFPFPFSFSFPFFFCFSFVFCNLLFGWHES